MEVDLVQTRIHIPDDLRSRQAQGELLVSITQAAAALLVSSGMKAIQITVEDPRDGSNMQVYVLPSMEPGEAQILESVAAAIGAQHIAMPAAKGMH